jgi:hypothetical protein
MARFQAICPIGDFTGQIRQTEAQANHDKDIHEANHPDHLVDVKTILSSDDVGNFVLLMKNHNNILKGEVGNLISGPFVSKNFEFFHVAFENDSSKFRKINIDKLKSFGPTIPTDSKGPTLPTEKSKKK